MNKHGGKRVGAGRPKSAPTKVFKISLDAEMLDSIKFNYTRSELSAMFRHWFQKLSKEQRNATCKCGGVIPNTSLSYQNGYMTQSGSSQECYTALASCPHCGALYEWSGLWHKYDKSSLVKNLELEIAKNR